MSFAVNETLYEKGIISLQRSDTNKKINGFEKQFENVSGLHTEIYNQPFLRFLLQTISKEGEYMTFDEIYQHFKFVVEKNFIGKTLNNSPFKQIICKNCKEPIYRFESNRISSLPQSLSCQNCKSPNYCDSFIFMDDWEIGVSELEYYLDKLCQINAIHQGYQAYCNKCIEINPLMAYDISNIGKMKKQELIDFIESLYCPRCEELGNVQKVYTFNEELFGLWESGNWLEWFVYRLLLESKIKFSYIDHGVILRKENKQEVEVDVLLLINDRVISIECKDVKVDKTAKKEEVDDILKLIDFSDVVVFVTTSNIESKTKKHLESTSKELKKPFIFIEGKDIESIPEVLESV